MVSAWEVQGQLQGHDKESRSQQEKCPEHLHPCALQLGLALVFILGVGWQSSQNFMTQTNRSRKTL